MVTLGREDLQELQVNTIDYITIQSTGDAVDFGDATEARTQTGGLNSPTRGIFVEVYTANNTN